MSESNCKVGGSLRQKFIVVDPIGNHLRVASTHLCRTALAPQLRVRSIVLGFMHTEYTDYPPVKSVCPPSRSWRGDTFVETKLKLFLQIHEPLPVLGADCV